MNPIISIIGAIQNYFSLFSLVYFYLKKSPCGDTAQIIYCSEAARIQLYNWILSKKLVKKTFL